MNSLRCHTAYMETVTHTTLVGSIRLSYTCIYQCY